MFNGDIESAIAQFLQDFPHAKILGAGRHRITFSTGDGYVVKFPRSCYAFKANEDEESVYRSGLSNYPVAECATVEMYGLTLLLMEEVKPFSYDEIIKSRNTIPWAAWVDSYQIGRNSKGFVVAYDFTSF